VSRQWDAGHVTVENDMRKPIRFIGSIAVAAILSSASPASAQGPNPAYNATLYYDAAHQNLMGVLTWTSCYGNIPRYTLSGTWQHQHYAVNELVGYCEDGEMVPL
jgi:hypothetical protein